MPTISVETLNFAFASTVVAGKYDDWQHYTVVWNAPPGGQKAMDIVAVDGTSAQSNAWLIEAKDFRIVTNPPKSSNLSGLAQTVADKARHTLAGLTDAKKYAVVPTEKNLASLAVASTSKRVILHLEPHTGHHTALFPVGFAASVLQSLKRLVNSIDPNPLVLNIANTAQARVPWSVT